MFCSISIILFHIIIQHFLIHILNVNPSGDDKMLIAFVRNDQRMQISEFSNQKYEAYLGILYFMRKNWHCDKIANVFEEYERTECQKCRKYLDILYEYLYREYAGIATVKPKFIFKNEIEHFEPKLLNEERLNYEDKLENETKLPINEMILQLAIDTANEWQTNESLDGIIRQKFEEELEKMLKKVQERAYRINNDNNMHWIIVGSKFDDKLNWIEDAFFTEFVKGLATNSEKFFKMAKEFSNYLSRKKEKRSVFWNDDGRMISFGLYEIEKMKKYLTQKYEAHLGVMYLMKENWNCDKEIGEEFKEKCKKYRKYLDILYEYFFRLYVEAKNPNLSKQLPPLMKPIFNTKKLIELVIILNNIWKIFWQKNENKMREVCDAWRMNLTNEDDLNYEIRQKVWENASKHENETNIAELRKEFEGLIKIQFENAKENAKEAKEKLIKAILESEDYKEKNVLKAEYDYNFGTFNSSLNFWFSTKSCLFFHSDK